MSETITLMDNRDKEELQMQIDSKADKADIYTDEELYKWLSEHPEAVERAIESYVDEKLNEKKETGAFDGADGKSAYQYAQDGGYEGTEEEFAEKLATDHIDWFGVGISISEGADLDTYKTNGKYYCNSESRAQNLLNRPDGMNTNFVMWVFQRTTKDIYSQLMLTLSGKMYIRSSSSSGWRSWVAYTTSGEIENLYATLETSLRAAILDELEIAKNSGDFTGSRGERGEEGGWFVYSTVTAVATMENVSNLMYDPMAEDGALAGLWVLVNGKRCYVGGNYSESGMSLYTDATCSTRANVSYAVGDLIYFIAKQETYEQTTGDSTVKAMSQQATTVRFAETELELAKRGLVNPERVNSLAELEQICDKSKVYVLPDGYIYGYVEKTIVTPESNTPNFTNLMDDPNAYIKEGYRYSQSSAAFLEDANTAAVVVPIPAVTNITIRVRGATLNKTPHGKAVYYGVNNQQFPNVGSGSSALTITKETNGDITITYDNKSTENKYVVFHVDAGFSNNNPIVTVNEEITYTAIEEVVEYGWANTGYEVPYSINLMDDPNAYIKEGYRYSQSSAAFLEDANTAAVVVPIPAVTNITIRVRGATLNKTPHGKSVYYGVNNQQFPNAGSGSSALTITKETNGDITITYDNKSTENKYVVFHVDAGFSNNNPIVTVNEEIKVEEKDETSNTSPINGTPTFVLTEAEDVADKVLAVRNADSFVMALASDFHTDGSDISATSVLHAGQGMDAVNSMTQLDLVALLGDYEIYGFSYGDGDTDGEDARKSFKHTKKAFSSVAKGVPFMMLQGNHDELPADTTAEARQKYYAYIGANNVGTVTDYPNKFRNYGYRDFENYKIRVIYLNTADVSDSEVTGNCNVSAEQLNWLNTVALNLDDAEWGIIVLSHHPLNWDGMTNLLNALDEYKGKGNGAELIVHFHGHLHNFRAETLGTSGIPTITIPNACFGRENEYGTYDGYSEAIHEAYGDTDENGEQRVFNKAVDTAEDTAFNVVVVDRQNRNIHCFNYGAGIDREISY